MGLARIAVNTGSDAREAIKKKQLASMGFKAENLKIADVYTIESDLNDSEMLELPGLLHNPVSQKAFLGDSPGNDFSWCIEIGFLPGVTDNIGNTATELITDFFAARQRKISARVYSSQELFLKGALSKEEAEKIALGFANPLIQRIHIKSREQFLKEKGMDVIAPVVRLGNAAEAKKIDLNLSDEELAKIGKEGILDTGTGTRRGPLALDLESMKAIRDFFAKLGRKPTDIEIESLAQTWSEHCKHTIFSAELDEIKQGIFKEKIKKATDIIRQKKGSKDNCVSVFLDNSGAIEFGKEWLVTDKVETHNSPSALDPFGGAITGIVGVNRDAIGFGKGAKPIVNRYGFCFASPFDSRPLYKGKNKSSKMLSPEKIMLGVIEGVNSGGNCSGIPTTQGFMFFDERYKGKPLVFVGTIGLIPRQINGKSSSEKSAMPGDLIVMAGGRVGLDGIHGATFSSEALSSGSPATAVQIGDPITQKKMSDAIIKEARQMELYSSITDNGAGGLSCSVAEMAKECNGCVVGIEKVPLKYPGMQPWQIWISESQERMTFAIPKENLEKFLDLMRKRGVEVAVIGEFTDSGKCIVKNNGETIMDIDLEFLHNGLPKKRLFSETKTQIQESTKFEEPCLEDAICKMLSRQNICSREFVSAQYDHEVQGSSVLKPLQGKGRVNADATAVRPLLDSKLCLGISHALYPSYGDIDCYWMAACAIDSAIKNLVCIGANPEEIALLDNFCWCSSNEPERLWQLKQAAQACFDFAVAFETPFISGKDSMFNDFKGYDENNNPIKISVPPTLLISSLAKIENSEKCVSMDAKFSGDIVFALGETKNELGASEYLSFMGEKLSGKKFLGKNAPKVDSEKSKKLYSALSNAIEKGLVASCQPVGLGGIGIAVAKICIASQLGMEISLQKLPAEKLRNDELLFSESQGRIVATLSKKNKKEFERIMNGNSFAEIGKVIAKKGLVIKPVGTKKFFIPIKKLENSYKKTFEGY
ncbi:MAG: phosphoribosylformylglycinamidine synthase subunit PurL [Candidatus ainarchaeum sp.]|nr:phosphoribosylformylglycinamidine synthase subunit PurL [Candidatus ainarchaeum sp.]